MIDVKAFRRSSRDVRLVDVRKLRPYLALSYCWGEGNSLTTERRTLRSRLRCITYNQLPRTFQDAVRATRKLGYRYVWIDALCIIQDSSQDWQRESQKMGSIYSQAVVTLSATSSSSVHDGLFNISSISQSSHFRNSMVVRNTTTRGEPTELLVYDTWSENSMNSPLSLTEGPLAQRAWTCQERILSPRILHFTDQQLFWEWREVIRAEERVQSSENSSGWYPPLTHIVRNLIRERGSRFDRLISWCYDVLHELYSSRQLTRNSDRLPAISGIARLLQDGDDMTYLAGLWKEELQFGLYWCVKERAPRSLSNPAPSWSWTSFETQICWWMSVYSRMPPAEFVVNHHSVELAGQDEFGAVNAASLNLTGRMCKIQIVLHPGGQNNPHDYHGEDEGDWSSELLDMQGIPLGAANLDRLPDTEDIFAFLLAVAPSVDAERWEEWELLLITPVSGSATFERIGIGEVSDNIYRDPPLDIPSWIAMLETHIIDLV